MKEPLVGWPPARRAFVQRSAENTTITTMDTWIAAVRICSGDPRRVGPRTRVVVQEAE